MAGAWLISDLVLTVQLAESRKVAEVGHGRRARIFFRFTCLMLQYRQLEAGYGSCFQDPRIRFGAFEVHRRSGELYKYGIRIKLQDQPFQLLVILLELPAS